MAKLLFNLIRERRYEVDVTQATMAEATGVNLNSIKQIESGRSITTANNIKKICDYLGLDMSAVYLENFKDTKVISITNNKGGSGKTTMTSNLGFELTKLGYKVLIIDADMQMNLTIASGFHPNLEKSLFHAFEYENDLLNYIQPTKYDNLDIIISDFEMAMCDMMLFTKQQRETVFQRMLHTIIDKGLYDFVLIDTNPNLGITNLNCFGASDFALIPAELSMFGLLGLQTLNKFFDNAVKGLNPKFEVLGYVRNIVDRRESITLISEENLRKTYGDKVLKTFIPKDTVAKKSQWVLETSHEYDKAAKVSIAYSKLAKEVAKLVK